MVGTAVKVMLPPEHIEVVGEVIVTVGVTLEVVIAMGLLVAVNGLAQGSLLVITTVTTSPLFKIPVVKVGLLVPAFNVFTFHW